MLASFSLYLAPECVYRVGVALSPASVLAALYELLVPTVLPTHLVATYLLLTAALITSTSTQVTLALVY